MDDVITGADTLRNAVTLQAELRELCTASGFPLRKWTANSEAILDGIPLEHRLQQAHHSWENEVHSTLGLRWHPASDDFSFAIQPRITGELRRDESWRRRLGYLTPWDGSLRSLFAPKF